MKDWSTKTFNRNRVADVPLADDFNSDFTECKNVVLPFMQLSESDDKQLVKSIGIMANIMFYVDDGSANDIHLIREAINGIEQYRDSMVLFFIPKVVNTGATTMQIGTLPPKQVKHNGNVLSAGDLNTEDIYMAIYVKSEDVFNISNLTGVTTRHGNPLVKFKVADGVDAKDAVNVSQLTTKQAKVDIIDNLTSTDVSKPLSANQGKVLKDRLDAINVKLTSDDISLDTLQEVVTYIKANKTTYQTLDINSINGLSTALNNKSALNHNHNDVYYLKSEVDTILDNKADVAGDATETFQASNGVDNEDAVTLNQLNSKTSVPLINYTEATDPLVTTNPPAVGVTWANTTSGEIFQCIGKTTNANHWIGTAGTEVKTLSTISVVDIFGDNSAISLYQFETDFSDTGGGVSIAPNGTTIEATDTAFGSKSAKVTGSDDMSVNTGSDNIKTISLWYKFISFASNDNYLLSYNDSGNTLNRISFANYSGTVKFNINGSSTGVYDGVPFVNNDSIPNNNITSGWHHFVFNISQDDRNDMDIGSYLTGNDSANANGYFDQIRLFNRALTSDEINQLMNEH